MRIDGTPITGQAHTYTPTQQCRRKHDNSKRASEKKRVNKTAVYNGGREQKQKKKKKKRNAFLWGHFCPMAIRGIENMEGDDSSINYYYT